MYCKKCGRPIDDGVNFCPYCGSELNNGTYHEYNNYQQNNGYYEPRRESSAIAYLALIFGLFGGLLGLILGIIGLVKYREPKNRMLSAIGIVLFLFWVFIFMFF